VGLGPPVTAERRGAFNPSIERAPLVVAAAASADDKVHREQPWSTLQRAAEFLSDSQTRQPTNASSSKMRRTDGGGVSSSGSSRGAAQLYSAPTNDERAPVIEYPHKSRDVNPPPAAIIAAKQQEPEQRQPAPAGSFSMDLGDKTAVSMGKAEISWVRFGPEKPRLSTQPSKVGDVQFGAVGHFRRGGSF
jgi:hypothetical protein